MNFWKLGDRLVCQDVFELQDQTCELCDKHPITRNYVVRNTRTLESVIFGSDCIVNYKQAFKNRGYTEPPSLDYRRDANPSRSLASFSKVFQYFLSSQTQIVR